jgi:hypothetical protein
MKNSKIILSVELQNDEIETKIAIAVDKYVQDIVNKVCTASIEKRVGERLLDMTTEKYNSRYVTINGKQVSFNNIIKNIVGDMVQNVLATTINDIVNKRLSNIMQGLQAEVKNET